MLLSICFKKYKIILENIIALFSIRGLEYLLALITLPYLVRVLGPEKYGAIAFAQSFVQYFSLIIDYGFNLTAIKYIAITRDDKERGEVFSSIIFSKIIIFLVMTIIFICCLIYIEYFHQRTELFLCTYLMTIGTVIFPAWFFQGIQKMQYVALMNILVRFIFVIGVFAIIKEEEDYILLALLQSLTTCVLGILSLFFLRIKYKYVYVLPKYKNIKKAFKDGWHIFISSIATNLYTTSNTVLLGAFTNDSIVGYFTGANKIIGVITGLLTPVSQAIYPYINKLLVTSKDETISFLKKILYVFSSAYFVIFLILFFFSKQIVILLLGEAYVNSIILIKIMSIVPFITSLSNVFIIQTMIPFGMQNLSSKIFIAAVMLHITLAVPLIYFFRDIGVVISLTITEIFITCMSAYVLERNNIDILGISALINKINTRRN